MNLIIPDEYELDTYGPTTNAFEKEMFEAIWMEMRRLDIRSGYLLGAPDAGSEGELCLHREGNLWAVYISERGKRVSPAFFSRARDAANFVVWMMCRVNDKTFPRIHLS